MKKEITYADAIIAINPNAVWSGTLEDLNWLESTTPISQSDIETKLAELKVSESANQATGNQKLLDLGLTQAEATALTGYTPPVAE